MTRPSGLQPAIGRRIRALRLSLGLSQQQLAELSGVRANRLSQIEQGNSEPGPAVLGRIERALATAGQETDGRRETS